MIRKGPKMDVSDIKLLQTCLHRFKRDVGPAFIGELSRRRRDMQTATDGTRLTNWDCNGKMTLLLPMCRVGQRWGAT